ncbi:MAG: hypothetical protein Q9M92_16155 [Enterobacterales bacterium]|nr:hypothetical protein [Enterobacterales bacterium]
MKLLKIMLCSVLLMLVISCGEGKYGSMSRSELTEKQRHCDSIPKKTAVFANGCEKIKKEIDRRRKNRNKK